MSKRGIRSHEGKYKQETRQKKRITQKNIIYSLRTKITQESLRDPIRAETICRTSYESLATFGYDTFKQHFSTTYIPPVDKGFILTDARGDGVKDGEDWYIDWSDF